MKKSNDAHPHATTSLFEKTKRVITAIQQLSLAKTHESIRDIVKHAARELVGSDGATFVLRENEHCYYVDEDAIAPLWKGKRFPLSACISGWVMQHNQSVVIPDIYQDPRIPTEAYRPTFVKSLVMVPIRKLNPIGAIGNYWQSHHTPTPEDISLLEALADSTAIAMENVTIYAELEQRVQDRTKQLALINQELEAFSYSVSHDLRAPLRAIDGFTTILLKNHQTELSDPAKELLSRIINSVKSMNELIEALLILSRITKVDIEHSPVNTTELCHDILQRYAETHAGSPISWSVDDGIEIVGDKKLLTILCENILSNACKFSSKHPKPHISVKKQMSDKQVIIEMSDNGVGFSMDQAEHVFKPFKRLHTEQEFSGTGIGLAIVHRIVSRHNWDIWVKSECGKGTTFYIAIPLASNQNAVN